MPVAFGRYVLHRKLATGGMAEIFLATAKGEAGFERTCVVKRVLPHLAADPAFISMFLDEARIVARLHHPGIAQIFDLGSAGEAYYIAMEYLPGADLGQVLRRTLERGMEFPLDVAAKVTSAAAEALHYAHEARADGQPLNIVHRDVSPSNLFLTVQGAVKVLDFGIARAERREDTIAGVVKGKAAYMAPEQSRGAPVDRRADLWSLGVCLYEMIAGVRLFSTVQEVREKPISPPGARRQGVPRELDDIVLRALARDPDCRYPTAEALREDLERFLADRSYVPQTTQLAQFVGRLFSPEEIERVGQASKQPVTGTVELESHTSATPGPEERTVLVTDVSLPPRKESRLGLRAGRLGLGAVLFLGLGAWGAWFAQRPGARAPAQLPAAAVLKAGSSVPGAPPAPAAPPVSAPLPPVASVSPAPPASRHVPAASHPPHHERERPGKLALVMRGAGTVFVDGRRVGEIPPNNVISLTPGEHLLEIVNPHAEPYRARVRIRPGEKVERSVQLHPQASSGEAP